MKKIILCPNPNRDRGMETTRRADAILRQMGFQTVVCPPFKDQKDGAYGDYKTRPLTAELKSADLLITFGGDGTILHLAKLVALNKIPVLGINMGGLGFIAELEAGELEALRKLKDWDFQTEQRMMLDVTVQREGRQIYTNLGLNDAVIREGPISHVIHLKISSDGGTWRISPETASSWPRPPGPRPTPCPPGGRWWSRWPRPWWSVPSAPTTCAFRPMSSRRSTR